MGDTGQVGLQAGLGVAPRVLGVPALSPLTAPLSPDRALASRGGASLSLWCLWHPQSSRVERRTPLKQTQGSLPRPVGGIPAQTRPRGQACVQNPKPTCRSRRGPVPTQRQQGHLDALGLCAAQPGVSSEAPGISPRSRWQSWSIPSGSRSWPSGSSDPRLRRPSACTGPNHRLHRPQRPERGPTSGRRRCWRGRGAGRGAQGRGGPVPAEPQPEVLQATPGPPLCPHRGAEAGHRRLHAAVVPYQEGWGQSRSQRSLGVKCPDTPGTVHRGSSRVRDRSAVCAGGGVGTKQDRALNV